MQFWWGWVEGYQDAAEAADGDITCTRAGIWRTVSPIILVRFRYCIDCTIKTCCEKPGILTLQTTQTIRQKQQSSYLVHGLRSPCRVRSIAKCNKSGSLNTRSPKRMRSAWKGKQTKSTTGICTLIPWNFSIEAQRILAPQTVHISSTILNDCMTSS